MQVCEEWFNRMRPLLLRLSFATDKHSSTIVYAYRLVQAAKAQLKVLLADMKASDAVKVDIWPAEIASGLPQDAHVPLK